MCGNEAERMLVGLGWEPKGLVSEDQLIHSMALVWREVRIHAQRATTARAFFNFMIIHVQYYSFIYLL